MSMNYKGVSNKNPPVRRIKKSCNEWICCRDGWFCLIDRKEECKDTSLSRALGPDSPTMKFNHCLGHCKTQPHAAITTSEMSLHLIEPFKHARQVAGRDSDASVNHSYFHITRVIFHFYSHMTA